MALLGKINRLRIVRFAPPGYYLDGGTHGEILLPARYIPAGTTPGDQLDVMVYRDTEDRLVATTDKPLAYAGEFAALRVVSLTPRIGVFLDWGLEKDLLLPIREMSGPVQPGDKVVVLVMVDPHTDRLIATARFNRFLDRTPAHYHEGESVRLLVASRSPIGYNMVINHAHRGLLYHTDVATPLKIGDWVEGYIRAIRPDGKFDLALGKAGYRRIADLTERIVAALEAAPGGELRYGDASIPEEIRDAFGVSKKAFKQAIGALYRERRITIEPTRIKLVRPDAAR